MRPYLVIEWNDTQTDAVGWLCIYNYIKGYTGGGVRMHPSVTREEVIRLAEVMAYKRNVIGNDRQGGCKSGIVYDYKAPDAYEVLKRFFIAMRPYVELGVVMGSDLGTTIPDIYRICDEIGMPRRCVTKSMKNDPVVQKGLNDVAALMKAEYRPGWLVNDVVTGFGAAFCADEAWKQMKGAPGAEVIIQGFGCVGKSAVRKMADLGYKITGIVDANCFVYHKNGLDVDSLIANILPRGEMDRSKFDPSWEVLPNTEWLNRPCDIFIPAALADVIDAGNAAQFKGKLISEGANIPISESADPILHRNGVHVVPDFVANAGAIRYLYTVTFGVVPPTPDAVVDDIEAQFRKNVDNLFKKSLDSGRYERELALELFKPSVQDPPEC